MRTLARDLALLALTVFVLIGGFVSAKFFWSHQLGPATSGFHGLAREREVAYLFLGSSLTRQSYDIGLIERETGKNAYAMAYNGLGPRYQRLIVEHLCQCHAPTIRRLIVEATPLLSLGGELYDVRLYLDAPPSLKWKILEYVTHSWSDWGKAYEVLVLSSNDAIFSHPFTGRFLDGLSYKGGYVNKVMPAISRETFDALAEPALLPGARSPSDIDIDSLRGIQDQLTRCGIEETYVEPPIPAIRRASPNYLAAKSALRGALASLGARLIDFPLDEFDAMDYRMFGDAVHLSSEGRARYSAIIARRIKDQRL